MSFINTLIQETLNVSVEEMEEQLQPVEGELEESVLEVVEHQGELDNQTEVIQRLETTAQSMEAFAIALEQRIEQARPLTAGEAYVMRVGLEALLVPCGYSTKAVGIGLEEFEQAPIPTEQQEEALQGEPVTVATEIPLENTLSETEALQASQEALDGIKAKLVAFWQAIKNAVLKVWDMIKNFVGKIFSSAKSLQARAVALEKAGSEVGSHQLTEFKVPGCLVISGKDGKATFTGAISGYDVGYSEVAKDVVALAKSFYTVAAKALEEAKEGKLADVSEVTAAFAAKGKGTTTLPGGVVAKPSEKGGIEVAVTTPAETTATGVTGTDVASVGSSVVTLCKTLAKEKDTIAAIQAQHKTVLDKAESVAKDAGKGFVGKTVDNAKVRLALRMTQRNFASPLVKVASLAVKAGYAAVSAGEKALKSKLSDKKEEAAPADKKDKAKK